MEKFHFKIIDDYLPHDKWQENYDFFLGTDIKWTYKAVAEDPNSYFFQYLFSDYPITCSNQISSKNSYQITSYTSPAKNIPAKEMPHYNIAIEPIVKNFKYERLLMVRSNLYTRMPTNYSYKDMNGAGFHNDFGYGFKYTTMIYYVNDNNGGTYFQNGQEVQSKANRLVVFDGHMLHRHICQTDEKAKISTNINIIV